MPGPPGGRLSVVRAPAQAVIDLAAIRSNVAALAGHAPTAQVMAVVKADGYGHGLLPCARAALAGGATWLGVAQATEALQLRAGGITARVLTWLYSAEAALDELLEADIDVSVSGAARRCAPVRCPPSRAPERCGPSRVRRPAPDRATAPRSPTRRCRPRAARRGPPRRSRARSARGP